MFQKTATGPDGIADYIFAGAGRTIVQEQVYLLLAPALVGNAGVGRPELQTHMQESTSLEERLVSRLCLRRAHGHTVERTPRTAAILTPHPPTLHPDASRRRPSDTICQRHLTRELLYGLRFCCCCPRPLKLFHARVSPHGTDAHHTELTRLARVRGGSASLSAASSSRSWCVLRSLPPRSRVLPPFFLLSSSAVRMSLARERERAMASACRELTAHARARTSRSSLTSSRASCTLSLTSRRSRCSPLPAYAQLRYAPTRNSAMSLRAIPLSAMRFSVLTHARCGTRSSARRPTEAVSGHHVRWKGMSVFQSVSRKEQRIPLRIGPRSARHSRLLPHDTRGPR